MTPVEKQRADAAAATERWFKNLMARPDFQAMWDSAGDGFRMLFEPLKTRLEQKGSVR